MLRRVKSVADAAASRMCVAKLREGLQRCGLREKKAQGALVCFWGYLLGYLYRLRVGANLFKEARWY
jgi:hypothetical protein